MICTQCKSQNPIGNKYCRECGNLLAQPVSPLALEDVTRADQERLSERVAGLLSAAFTLSEQRRFDQALPIAEEAVMLLPQSTSALSLLATLLEQTGQTSRPVTVMERVVFLNPESPADREKLDFLRKKPQLPMGTVATQIARTAAQAPVNGGLRSNHWAPYVLAGAAAACVLGILLSMVNRQQSPRTIAATAPAGMNAIGAVSPVTTAGEMSTNARSAAEVAAASANVTPPRVGGVAPTETGRADPFSALTTPVNPAPLRDRASSGASLPALKISANRPTHPGDFPASSTAGSDPGGTLPPIIAVPPTAGASGFGATQSNPSLGVGPGNTGTSNQGALEMSQGANAAPPPTPTPYIRITVGGSGAGTQASSPSRSGNTSGNSAGGEALARARHLQSTGRYSDAIAAYQDSLASGTANSGEVQQGIAQSYARLGNDSAARNAYRDAIRSFQAQVAAGRNVGAAARGIEACKAALEALGGD